MSTMHITADRALRDLRPGDRIIAIDGRRLREPRQVRRPHVCAGLSHDIDAVGLVNARGTDTEWNLYPAAFKVLTIERVILREQDHFAAAKERAFASIAARARHPA